VVSQPQYRNTKKPNCPGIDYWLMSVWKIVQLTLSQWKEG